MSRPGSKVCLSPPLRRRPAGRWGRLLELTLWSPQWRRAEFFRSISPVCRELGQSSPVDKGASLQWLPTSPGILPAFGPSARKCSCMNIPTLVELLEGKCSNLMALKCMNISRSSSAELTPSQCSPHLEFISWGSFNVPKKVSLPVIPLLSRQCDSGDVPPRDNASD